jgi:hypothetical protein
MMCGICGKVIPRGYACNCRDPFNVEELELLYEGVRCITAKHIADPESGPAIHGLRLKVAQMLGEARVYALMAAYARDHPEEAA